MTIEQMKTKKLDTFTAECLLNKTFRPRETVIDPWLRTEETAVIWAASGVGKTWMCLSLALTIAGGGSMADWTAPKARTVIYYDAEMHAQDLQDRIRKLMDDGIVRVPDRALTLRNLTIVSRQSQRLGTDYLDLMDEADQRQMVRELVGNYEVAFFDNLTTMSDGLGDENSATDFKPLQRFFMELKRGGVVGVLVHHANKTGYAMRGSTSLATTFEAILALRAPRVTVPGKSIFEADFEKYRAKGDSRIERRQWTLMDDAWQVTDSEPARPEDDRVLLALKSLEFVSQQEIADHLQIDKSTVSRRLSKLEKQEVLKPGEAEKLFKSARDFRNEIQGTDDEEHW